jgi:hypothetical protein
MRRPMLAMIVLAVVAAPALAQLGTPVKSGQASFTLGAAALTWTQATGDLTDSSGLKGVTVTFADAAKPDGDRLTISVMVKGPGAVDLNQPMGYGIVFRTGGNSFRYIKGKSQCSLTLMSVTGDLVEGTATCPVLNQETGSATLALTDLRFSAATK